MLNIVGVVMFFLGKILVSLGLITISSITFSSPVTTFTAEKYFPYLDAGNMIKVKDIDPQKYSDYAQSITDMHLHGEIVDEKSRIKAMEKVEEIYKSFVLNKLSNIQQESVQIYRNEFLKNQSEEVVSFQIDFYKTQIGKSILAKQELRRIAILNSYGEITELISEQLDLQKKIKELIENGEIK